MGLLSWLRRPQESEQSLQARLLETFLTTEQKRLEFSAQVESKKQDLELRKLELEVEHLSEISEEKRKDAREKEALRAVRKEQMANARHAKAVKRASAGAANGQLPVSVATCEECRALLLGRTPNHTDDLMRHNTEQHIKLLDHQLLGGN